MELSEIRQEVRFRAGYDAQDAMASDEVLNSFINASLRSVANARDWDWAKNEEEILLTVGESEYHRDARARTSLSLVLASDRTPLKLITHQASTRYDSYQGRPRVWFVDAGHLVVYPTPVVSETMIHRFLEVEETLENDTDEPTIPDYAIDLVIIRAALKLAARVDNTSQFQLLRTEEVQAVKDLVDDARRSKGAPVIDTRRDWQAR